MDSTTYGERLQDHSAAPLLCPDRLNTTDYSFCHYAKCATGWDVNCEKWLLVAITCKRWGCPWCADRKIRRLAYLTKEAKPNRLLTLTVSTHRYPDPQSAWDGMAKAFPELMRFARSISAECEYLKVLEIHQNGYPHFHCLLRSSYLHHPLILAEWRRLIAGPDDGLQSDDAPKAFAGVNIKKVDDSFRTYFYLVKYLTKLHKVPFTDRRVSYSKNFFNPADLEQTEYAKLDSVEKYDQHPWVWLRERLAWEHVPVLDHGKWIVGDNIPPRYQEIDPAAIGLPGPPPAAPPPPLKQRYAPGIEDAPITAENDNRTATGKRRRVAKRPYNPAKIDQPPPVVPTPVEPIPF